MNLTKSKIKALTLRALEDKGISAEVLDVEWLGVRTRARHGDEYFRCAKVALETPAGYLLWKYATIDTAGGFMIR